MTIPEIVYSLIGAPKVYVDTVSDSVYTSVTTAVYYDMSYITSAILLIVVFVGIVSVILNFQKSFSRGGSK